MRPSSTERSRQVSLLSLTGFSIALLALGLLVKIGGAIWINKRLAELSRERSYVGNDHPESWPIIRRKVLMGFENPNHFRLDTEDGISEWKGMLPGGDGILHLGAHHQPYGVSMFHQLRCLDIIRDETVLDRSDGRNISELGRHCLNYIRQMVMCRGDLELESFQFASHKNPINLFGFYECKDWEGVYNDVKKNQEIYRNRLRAAGK